MIVFHVEPAPGDERHEDDYDPDEECPWDEGLGDADDTGGIPS